MSVPYVPRAMYDGGNHDVEAINQNLRAIQRNIKRAMDLRYSTTPAVFPLTGLSSAAAASQRTLRITLPTSRQWQVVGAELVVCATAGATWSVSAGGTLWTGLSVATAGATTEAYDISEETIDPSAGVFTFTFSADVASTITSGYFVIHVCCDRGLQGSADFTGYSPTLLSSASSTDGSVLDTEMAAISAAVAQHQAATTDLRMQIFAVRDLASGGSTSMSLPSGSRTGTGATALQGAVVGPLGSTVSFSVSSTSFATVSKAVNGLGAAVLAQGSAAFSEVDANAPATAASDLTLTISRGADGGAVAPLSYMIVWWS